MLNYHKIKSKSGKSQTNLFELTNKYFEINMIIPITNLKNTKFTHQLLTIVDFFCL